MVLRVIACSCEVLVFFFFKFCLLFYSFSFFIKKTFHIQEFFFLFCAGTRSYWTSQTARKTTSWKRTSQKLFLFIFKKCSLIFNIQNFILIIKFLFFVFKILFFLFLIVFLTVFHCSCFLIFFCRLFNLLLTNF